MLELAFYQPLDADLISKAASSANVSVVPCDDRSFLTICIPGNGQRLRKGHLSRRSYGV